MAQVSCEACTLILRAFATPASEFFNCPLGTLKNLLASSCPHTQLIRWASQEWSDHKAIISVRKAEDSTHAYLVHEIERSNASRWSEDFGLIALPERNGHPGRVRVFDPEWVNTGIARDWLSRCEIEHGRRCEMHRVPNLGGRRPRWLVDVVDGCICSGALTLDGSQPPYVTLSYTWGMTATLQANSSNFAQLQEPGVLFSGDMSAQMPQTIRDAVGITKAIGYRFLWVDSLCIQQDARDEEMASELSAMHLIYANSALCLVAEAGANAGHGLRGFPGVSSSGRHAGQVIMPLADGEQVARFDSMAREGERKGNLAYHSRMWTFQEYLFAKRRLVFAQGPLEWHCNGASWREDLIGEVAQAQRDTGYRSWGNEEKWVLSPMPLLDNLNDLIQNFNLRLVSYPEDVPRAFAGTQAMLHRAFPGGLLLGLPEFWFDIALWWLGDYHCRRRTASATTDPNLALPSWSWMGWQGGRIFFPGDAELSQAGGADEYGFTAPVTTWYAITDPKHPPGQGRKIASAWSVYKGLAEKLDRGHDLPDGWRSKTPTLPSHSPLRCPKLPPAYGFFHESTSREFWYPVPAAAPEQATPASMAVSPQTRYLTCKTTRAFLYASPDMIQPILERKRLQVLRDNNGAFVGVLNLYDASDDRGDLMVPIIPASTLGDTGKGAPIELVAVLKGWTDMFSQPYNSLNGAAIERPWDPHWHSRTDQSGSACPSWVDEDKEAWDTLINTKDDCYFALWVEWREGIAYRKGTGVVVAQRWDEAREESLVDLILG